MEKIKLKQILELTKELTYPDLKILYSKVESSLKSKEEQFISQIKEDSIFQDLCKLFGEKFEFQFMFKNTMILGAYSLNNELKLIPNMSKNLDAIHLQDEEITKHYNKLVESGTFDEIRERAMALRFKVMHLLNNLGTKYDIHHSYVESLLLKEVFNL
jgi:hypothetical protein